jgi:phenylacetate-coenzyme A ligase PaaK-like adenylate-forming protein
MMPPGAVDTGRAERDAAIRAGLPVHIDRLTWDRERIAPHQTHALRVLLRHALAHSRFHLERLDEVDVDRFELDDLPTLPTMTKREMMGSLDEVLTDTRLSRDVVEEHLARSRERPSELFGEYVVLASGGSSGERGTFVYSRAAAADYMLGLKRAGMKRLLAAGTLPPTGVSMAMVAAGSGIHATRALSSLFGSDLISVTTIAATQPLAAIVEQLNELQPTVLQGYPFILDQLAGERRAGRLRIAPLAITANSEQLTLDTRARIASAFGVPVSNGFGSSEGVLGTSSPEDPVIVIASDLAIVELVDDENRPVPLGTPSAKALITNLFNLTQPLIRYELNDSFVRHPETPDHGHLRVTVEGRADTVFRWGAVVVQPIAIRSILVARPGIAEYQVRQTPRGVHVDVVAPGGIDHPALRRELTTALAATGFPDPEATSVSVAAIERNTETAKARRFVPL